jgi:hypothetical protein
MIGRQSAYQRHTLALAAREGGDATFVLRAIMTDPFFVVPKLLIKIKVMYPYETGGNKAQRNSRPGAWHGWLLLPLILIDEIPSLTWSSGFPVRCRIFGAVEALRQPARRVHLSSR